MTRTRLAVLGSPISHSRSPDMHRAAYEVLALDYRYDAIEIPAPALSPFVRSLDASWRGLSLTMPLKHDIIPFLDRLDSLAQITGAVNTVLIDDDGFAGFNTDVAGIVGPLADAGASHPATVLVLGAGATAGSAVAAAGQLGASAITVAARDVERARALTTIGSRLGVTVTIVPLHEVATVSAELVINTLPGGAADALSFPRRVRAVSVLLDVIYDPWPTVIATSWADAGGLVIPGLEMLLAQALQQVRIFVGGAPDVALDRELEVSAAMRASVLPRL